VDSNSEGFIAMISPVGSFPYATYEGIEIRPGVISTGLVGLTGFKRSINRIKRIKRISPVGSFPYATYKGIKIRPGVFFTGFMGLTG